MRHDVGPVGQFARAQLTHPDIGTTTIAAAAKRVAWYWKSWESMRAKRLAPKGKPR